MEVKAYVRRYHRQRYQKTCKCVETPRVIVTPSAPRIINKGKLGISLLNKYAFGIPINRQLESFKSQGLNLSQGTISGGQQAMLPFFEPVVDAIRLHVSESNQWHADKTRWIVWKHDKKGSDKHWLWVFICDEVAYYDIAKLQRQHLNEKAKKVLTSLKNHWRGLTKFVYNPVITMDNNAAESALRNPITGRKNYYGAGSEWSIKLSAWLFMRFYDIEDVEN